jgi:hypothetical protein
VESPNAGEKVNPGELQVVDGSWKKGEKEDPGARRNLELALREEHGQKDVGTIGSPGKKPDPNGQGRANPTLTRRAPGRGTAGTNELHML